MLSIVLIPVFLGLRALAATLVDQQFPHLIVPLKQDAPSTAFGTKYEAELSISASGSSQVYTEISFDVPPTAASSCNLAFDVNTSPAWGPWILSGQEPITFNISSLEPKVNKDTDSWNSRPKTTGYVGTVEVWYNGNVKVSGGQVECKKGQVAQFLLYPANEQSSKWHYP
ncbi:hypothetical protein P154DRAFT_549442 [Amniculicola lignicola CBS 123094]|uniref:Ubiquitin 3 binding protein But2 C-terminal domain-containing protein n=1 Tax=Amniculicola lignicola CBS 123094 TaxID=1392246 RepID=A0A6A5VY68_9PLEO|nr:hypothetical protein P154DRAFT_549442 [Amniculicola lignicola CBS 123094]